MELFYNPRSRRSWQNYLAEALGAMI
jgi:hypothetical protein